MSLTKELQINLITRFIIQVQYAKEMNLQGLSVWSLETDDFHGTCGKTNILLKAINESMVGSSNIS